MTRGIQGDWLLLRGVAATDNLTLGASPMGNRMQYLEEFADLVGRLNNDGFSELEIREMLDAAASSRTRWGPA